MFRIYRSSGIWLTNSSLVLDGVAATRSCGLSATQLNCGDDIGICACTTDLCNGAVRPGMTTASALILFASVAMYIFAWWKRCTDGGSSMKSGFLVTRNSCTELLNFWVIWNYEFLTNLVLNVPVVLQNILIMLQNGFIVSQNVYIRSLLEFVIDKIRGNSEVIDM